MEVETKFVRHCIFLQKEVNETAAPPAGVTIKLPVVLGAFCETLSIQMIKAPEISF